MIHIFAPPQGRAAVCITDKPAALLAAEEGEAENAASSASLGVPGAAHTPGSQALLLSVPNTFYRTGFISVSRNPASPGRWWVLAAWWCS